MLRTLMDISKYNLNLAKREFSRGTLDEMELNGIAYHLQQSIELAIKHHLEINGVQYPFTHNINTLIQLVEDNNLDIKFPEMFEYFAPTFTEWEASTRYIKDYSATRKSIEIGMKLVEEFYLLNNSDSGFEEAMSTMLMK